MKLHKAGEQRDSHSHHANASQNQRKVVIPASFRGPDGSKMILRSPGAVFRICPVALDGSTMDRCLLHAHCSIICFIVTDTRVQEPGPRLTSITMSAAKTWVGGLSE